MGANDTITITIMSPNAIVWQGMALSLSSHNSEGDFDIMPDHARFMTLIEKTPIIIHANEADDKTFSYDSAVLFFHDNHATVYIQQE